MRINPEVETKWRDMTGEIHIPETSHCPNQIKKICENILTMYTGLDGVCPTSYNTMSELDKMIMLDYWRNYDGMETAFSPFINLQDFQKWFGKSATPPELVRRSIQYLSEHHAALIDSRVKENAMKASENFRHSVKR
jgi:hypothetical protein